MKTGPIEEKPPGIKKTVRDGPTRADDFWAFSLALYARPDVADACLDAQDRLGADVNLLLLTAWLAAQGRMPETQSWTQLIAVSSRWQRDILGPLRARRRALKGHPGYEAIKDKELETEKTCQAALVSALGVTVPLSADPFDPYRRHLDPDGLPGGRAQWDRTIALLLPQ